MLRFLFFVTVVTAILSFADAIWNGETPEPNQYPSTVGLILENLLMELCAGALISKNFVLTTATCVNFNSQHIEKESAKKIEVVLGAHHSNFKEYVIKYIVGENDVIIHPEYDENENMQFDIGLIRLPESVEESDRVKIASLPPENLELPVGQDIIITGWGKLGNNENYSDELKVLNTKVVPKEICSKSDESVMEDNICIYTSQKSVCIGDSGNPNYIREAGDLILVGLNQRLLTTEDNEASCERNVPHLSISIIPYLSWINTEINK